MLGTPLGRILLDRPAWTYLLGPFFKSSTPDQSAPLPATYREAGAVGALTVVDTESKLSIAAGALVVASGKAAPAYGDPSMIAATAVARVTGRAVVATVAISGANDARFGFALTAASECNAFRFNATNQVRLAEGGVGLNLLIGTLTTALANQYAVVLRSAGAWHLVRAPADALWTLLYVATVQPSPSVYAVMSNTNATISATNFRVADLPGAWASDYGIALARSTFTAADSTNLTAITPEVGETWTVRSGTWAIQSNKAQRTSTGNHEYAVIDARASDYLVECTIVTAVSNPSCGLVVRESDASGYWLVAMAGGVVTLYEYDGAAFTSRASGGSITTNTSYRVVVICAGSTITAYVNNVQVCTYASATRNQTATFCGIRAHGINDTTSTFDDFIAWPRTVALPTGV